MNHKTGAVSLNAAQRKAVEHKSGPMMVLAGPGSGKTFVLIEHIRYMTEQLGIRPDSILVITFTREAAAEMRSRAQIKGVRDGVCFGTFHSVFLQLIIKYYGYKHSDVADRKSCIKVLHRIMRSEGFNDIEEFKGATADMAEYAFNVIGQIKNGKMHPSVDNDTGYIRLYNAYIGVMRRLRKIDYDDMLLLCKKLLNDNPNILAELRERFRYILVDEFQDINSLQFDIVRLLAYPRNDLFIVGDDDQSIYGFRGSRPEIMLSFGSLYPGADRVLLDINYRSTEAIVNASLRLIKNNKNRYQKKLVANIGGGRPVRIQGFADEIHMLNELIAEIKLLNKAGMRYSDTAVLYRVNNNGVRLAAMLDEAGIKYTVNKKSDDGLSLMTFHASKGLEFEQVYIIYAVDGITPWKAATGAEELSEERRMFYVAMTRAKKQLHIFYTKRIYNVKRKRSIFVDEIL